MTRMCLVGVRTHTAGMTYDPHLEVARRWPFVEVITAHMTGGRLGEIRAGGLVIALRADVSAAQQRCTLAHEIVHLERGLLGCRGQWRSKEERHVHEIAAARLISLEQYAAAIIDLGREDIDRDVAAALGVDRITLRTRRGALTELEQLRMRMLLPAELLAG
jgi:hypothetical protein